ncbi:hypothetical protein HOP50_01g03800 [Chloropicon primus]|nr:hypothetical protein HOP50_01g03800 [Chloropicon primus]
MGGEDREARKRAVALAAESVKGRAAKHWKVEDKVTEDDRARNLDFGTFLDYYETPRRPAPADQGASAPAEQDPAGDHGASRAPDASKKEEVWYYEDISRCTQGPFTLTMLHSWVSYMPMDVRVWCQLGGGDGEREEVEVGLRTFWEGSGKSWDLQKLPVGESSSVTFAVLFGYGPLLEEWKKERGPENCVGYGVAPTITVYQNVGEQTTREGVTAEPEGGSPHHAAPVPSASEREVWYYEDISRCTQGPFTLTMLHSWVSYMPMDVRVWCQLGGGDGEREEVEVGLRTFWEGSGKSWDLQKLPVGESSSVTFAVLFGYGPLLEEWKKERGPENCVGYGVAPTITVYQRALNGESEPDEAIPSASWYGGDQEATGGAGARADPHGGGSAYKGSALEHYMDLSRFDEQMAKMKGARNKKLSKKEIELLKQRKNELKRKRNALWQ